MRFTSQYEVMCKLPSKTRNDIQDRGRDNADQDGSAKRKVDRKVLGLVGDITGQTTQREAGPASEQQYCPDEHDEKSETYESFAKFSHGSLIPTFSARIQGTGRAQLAASGPRQRKG